MGRTAVLVVDDEAAVSEVIAEVLEAEGHEVETAANAALALERLRARAFDLVLCDVQMPGMNGPALYREAQHIDGRLALRFVFVTGDVFTADTAAFLATSGAPCLAKPFRAHELHEVVGRTLGGD
jgi:CheY-like chemotaxis protein